MKNSEKPIQPISDQYGVPFDSEKRNSIFNDLPKGFMIGLTKREYFFAAVLQGLCANASKNINSPEYLVDLAEKITDESVKVLDKKK